MARRAARDQATLFGDQNQGAPVTETGVLYRDDNLTVLNQLPSESVDLIYLDPPFFTNRYYEVIWGEEAEVRSFEDRWAGGIQNYIEWMKGRTAELHRVLRPTGSLYLHCDPHASHYLKLMLDGLFGQENFRNEIVWKRTSAHSDAQRYGSVHDTILFYVKSGEHKWNRIYQRFDPAYVEAYYRFKDRTGRLFMSDNLSGAGPGPPRTFGDRGEIPPPRGRHWMFDQEGIDKALAEDRIYWTRNGVPRLKQYLDEAPGLPATDVWTDIQALRSWHTAEKLGYPTQKPEALLERIIKSSSEQGDVVLDPFCGCGTTVAVADRLDRQWIGIDISATAIQVMERRLRKQDCKPTIINAVQTMADLKELKPFEFQNWIINAIFGTHSPKKVGDMGIDGYWFFTRDPVQVKQSEHVGRNVVDNFETAIRRAKHTTGYIIAFSFTKGAVEEVARVKKEGLDIRLVKVAEVLLLVKRPHGKLGPQPGDVEEMPIPLPRQRKDMPSAEELIESDKEAVGEGTGAGPRIAASTKERGPRAVSPRKPRRKPGK
ncbi:MAG: site-specific DNA-methyltransferase [Actinobacteria bacterium]|nr:site-specific DNA-methyltransferase [Actinomycetota bacterium]